MIELKINNAKDRENTVVALVNAGYTVRTVHRDRPNTYGRTDCFIQVLVSDSTFQHHGIKVEFKPPTSGTIDAYI